MEGYCVALMNREKGRHTSQCEQFNDQLVASPSD